MQARLEKVLNHVVHINGLLGIQCAPLFQMINKEYHHLELILMLTTKLLCYEATWTSNAEHQFDLISLYLLIAFVHRVINLPSISKGQKLIRYCDDVIQISCEEMDSHKNL